MPTIVQLKTVPAIGYPDCTVPAIGQLILGEIYMVPGRKCPAHSQRAFSYYVLFVFVLKPTVVECVKYNLCSLLVIFNKKTLNVQNLTEFNFNVNLISSKTKKCSCACLFRSTPL